MTCSICHGRRGTGHNARTCPDREERTEPYDTGSPSALAAQAVAESDGQLSFAEAGRQHGVTRQAVEIAYRRLYPKGDTEPMTFRAKTEFIAAWRAAAKTRGITIAAFMTEAGNAALATSTATMAPELDDARGHA